MEAEEWLDEPLEDDEEVDCVVPLKPKQYLSYRFSYEHDIFSFCFQGKMTNDK